MYSLRIQGDEMAPMWGPERADNAMAANSMLEADVPFTLHHDAPITAPSVLPGVESAVTRLTMAGKVLGPDQRISPYQALRAVTATAAWQIREENTKGTLEDGKLADLVILDRNPLKVDPLQIDEIRVLETLKEGNTIYRAAP
jgi:predicted amidohydrolase YtcJ